ncbi:hypothetical protein HY988_00185 [Candidatus Micrarchaeota archaeon]|nr:hypothetical protein [Candidatus Micrarchaeota archaeon]
MSDDGWLCYVFGSVELLQAAAPSIGAARCGNCVPKRNCSCRIKNAASIANHAEVIMGKTGCITFVVCYGRLRRRPTAPRQSPLLAYWKWTFPIQTNFC